LDDPRVYHGRLTVIGKFIAVRWCWPEPAPRLAEEKRAPQPGLKEEKNSLDEGEAVLIWPEQLSADKVRDLEHWLKGILRKAKRRAGVPAAAN
jgi:hypothetical protein